MGLNSSSRGWRGLGAMVVLAGLGLATIWATHYFGTEARLTRATQRLIRVTEKKEPESAVTLALAADRFGKMLTADAVLILPHAGAVATGRQEIIALFVQTRSALTTITFARPRLQVQKVGPSSIRVHVRAHVYLAVPGEGTLQEDGRAQLIWRKKSNGWRVARAELSLLETDPPKSGFP